MYVFLACFLCRKRTRCENRLWFKHLLNVLHLYTHTHTLKTTHTHWDTNKDVHPRKKVPGDQHLSPSPFDDVVFLYVVTDKLNKKLKKDHKQRKKKIESFHKVSELTHSHTHTCTLAGHNVLSSFLSPFPLLFLPSMFLLLLSMLLLLLLSPLTKDFPSVHNDETRKNRNTSPALSQSVCWSFYTRFRQRKNGIYDSGKQMKGPKYRLHWL